MLFSNLVIKASYYKKNYVCEILLARYSTSCLYVCNITFRLFYRLKTKISPCFHRNHRNYLARDRLIDKLYLQHSSVARLTG